MQVHLLHIWFYRIMRAIITPPIKGYFHFEPIPAPELSPPYLVVANHTTDYDPLFVALSFPQHMYFVASEHIFRLPFLRFFFKNMLDPILKRKGGADISTAMQILRRLRAGKNVMLFAEGNKSFDGLTCAVHPATGGMVRACGATLVTYRLSGGYFTSPRWAHTLRRGKVKGETIAVYPAQTLRTMTDAQINDLITRDISEDAYARQGEKMTRYHGKKLAEGIQNALYLCPVCLQFGTLYGKDDEIRCACGWKTKYSDTGFLHGTEPPFDTLTGFCAWQRQELARMLLHEVTDNRKGPVKPAGIPHGAAEAQPGTPLIHDADQTIVQIFADHSTKAVAQGRLSLSRSGLRCADFFLPLHDLMGLEIYGRNTIVFSDAQGKHYQVVTQDERSGLKYFDAYQILIGGGL